MSPGYLAGVDIGGTKLAAVVADRAGEVRGRVQVETDLSQGEFSRFADGTAYDGLARRVKEILHAALAKAGATELAGIGIGAAGPLAHGAILNPTNMVLPSIPPDLPPRPLYLPLVEPLRREFSVPVRLENDCNTAVLGEVEFGVGEETANKEELHIVYVTISTGLGAGVWSGGRVLLGKDGNAAEIGHILVREGGLRCGCGNYGCAEAYCSGRGIVRNARSRLVQAGMPADSHLLQLAREGGLDGFAALAEITPPLVFAAAEEGDEIARAVIADVIYAGGVALAAIANAYDPAVITLGGSIAINHPELCAPMAEEMHRHLNVVPPEVRITPLGTQAVEYGALVLARQVATA